MFDELLRGQDSATKYEKARLAELGRLALLKRKLTIEEQIWPSGPHFHGRSINAFPPDDLFSIVASDHQAGIGSPKSETV